MTLLQVDALIDRLRDDDIEVRERAEDELVRGRPALAELRSRYHAARDAEVRARLSSVVRRVLRDGCDTSRELFETLAECEGARDAKAHRRLRVAAVVEHLGRVLPVRSEVDWRSPDPPLPSIEEIARDLGIHEVWVVLGLCTFNYCERRVNRILESGAPRYTSAIAAVLSAADHPLARASAADVLRTTGDERTLPDLERASADETQTRLVRGLADEAIESILRRTK